MNRRQIPMGAAASRSTAGVALAWLLAAAAWTQPAPGASAIPIYGDANPGSPTDEVSTGMGGRDLRSVTYPTLTPVLPEPGTANGTAVIVAPGGGFMFLAMEHEGRQVARALADHGVTAFVLKYRVNPTPRTKTRTGRNCSS